MKAKTLYIVVVKNLSGKQRKAVSVNSGYGEWSLFNRKTATKIADVVDGAIYSVRLIRTPRPK